MTPQIRISRRAKYVTLRMSFQHGLQIVVPRGYNLQKIPRLLEEKRVWIESATRRLAKKQAALPPVVTEKLPPQIVLTALGETWRVEYLPKDSARVTLKQSATDLLILTGQVENMSACQRILRRWLLQRGQKMLSPWLRQVSEELGLPFQKASVRLQSSRWGSCSRRKTISVNAKLLFMRPEVVRYLFIHELCHLVHMNHSDRYWKLVASKSPGYQQLDAELRHAMRIIPRWAENTEKRQN